MSRDEIGSVLKDVLLKRSLWVNGWKKRIHFTTLDFPELNWIPFLNYVSSWESKGTPPIYATPRQEIIRPTYLGIIRPLIRPAISWG